MQEDKRPIKDYEGLYEITKSGKIYSVKRKRFLSRCNDEYGFHIVKLSKDGKSKNHNVFKLWQNEFKGIQPSEFKGAMKAIYK
ncbi:NUMOD4 domain-containing protein [Peribacillus butanolivorans]|uniref:NUMOD4 domain-containing protein n=1 Tax=Peribacillus butanolivorans TaxID=421767 RepID=UPI00369B18E2